MSKISLTTLQSMHQRGEKFTCLTAYDASFTCLMEQAGVEVLLVGDSLGMVLQGQQSTLSVTMEDMLYHIQNVARVSKSAMIMADMPFLSYTHLVQTMDNAAKLMRAGAHIIKLEGGMHLYDTVKALSESGVPVCVHLGLLPQSVHKMGGYKIQGKTPQQANILLNTACHLQEAGADIILLECVPADVAKTITHSVDIPVIGIGAGNACDAQVLVSYDMLGISCGKIPRFCKNYLAQQGSILAAFECYVQEVKQGLFPTKEQSF